MNRSVTTTSLRSHTAVASGFLHKLTHNGTPLARWHQRYYVLYTDGLLCSYKSSRARNSHRIIHVGRKCLRLRFGLETRHDECSRWPKNRRRTQCFSIINSDREYHFYCDSEREFAIWRDNLRQILTKLGSAHTSYVERRNSKLLNGMTNWLDGDDSSTEPTPASLRKLKPWVDKVDEDKETQAQELVENEGSMTQDGYDTVDPAAVPYTNLDDGTCTESDIEKNVDETEIQPDLLLGRKQVKRQLSKDRLEVDTNTDQVHTPSEDEALEQVSINDESNWTVPSYYNDNNIMDSNDEVSMQKSTTYGALKGIDAAFLEVQNILDQTFNDMC